MLTMDQVVNVILAIDKVHTSLQRALVCGPDMLNQVYGQSSSTDR